MQLDVGSLLFALTLTMVTMAVALPAVMGRTDRAARRAQAGMVLKAAGFSALLLSSTLVRGGAGDWALSTLSMAGISFGLAMSGTAFSLWCGRNARQRTLYGLAALLTAGYAAAFHHYEFRVGWANGLSALQMLLISHELARRPAAPVGRWRWLLVATLVAQALTTAGRGALGAFFSDVFPRFNAPHPVNIAFALVGLVSNVLLLVGILLAHRDRSSRELERLASVDGLTGVLNRRAWLARADAELARAVEADEAMAVVMIDIDHFKRVNDTLGHEVGDQALRFVAKALRDTARGTDIVGRYGGEEFCIVMKQANHAGAKAFDRRLREALAEGGQRELGFPMAYSAGIAMRASAADTLQAMLKRADDMLYRAKDAGRGRTLSESGPFLQVA